jgi:hypothetical protein
MNPGSSQAEKQSTFEFIGRAFRYRTYRLYFGGQGVSLIGTWMQQIAMSWLVYRLTDSAFYLGLIGFTGHAPLFFLSSFAGVFINRIHGRNLLIITQTFGHCTGVSPGIFYLKWLYTGLESRSLKSLPRLHQCRRKSLIKINEGVS